MGSRTKKRASPEPRSDSESPQKRARNPDDKENTAHKNKSVQNVAPALSAVAAVPPPFSKRQPTECGVITRIHCENFMCHRSFTIDLCRNVNFIYGQNGSGKSAILAAIQICLGAGARRTHRARNVQDLVRKDSTAGCAKVRVTLLNQGSDAYHPELYGGKITVERTIATRGGYNGYKLLDENGKEVSRSKRDLDDLLDKVNAQVENPVAILDQEEAKKFLTGKSEDKYAFFMKATELERIDRTIAATTDQVMELQEQEQRMAQSLFADKELMLSTKRQFEQHQEIGKLQAKLSGMEEALAWAFYQQAKKNLDEQLENAREFRDKAEKKLEELTQAEAATQEGNSEEHELRTRVQELSDEANSQADRKRDAEVDYKKAREPVKALERQLKTLGSEKSSAERTLQQAKRRLEQKRQDIMAREGSKESDAAKRIQRLQQAEETFAQLKTEYDQTKQEVTDSLRAYEELEPNVLQAKANVQDMERRRHAIDSKIRSLESGSGDSLAVFGQRVPQLKALVEKHKRQFHGPVKGPIGSFLKIAPGKEAFGKLAELGMGSGVLDRFIVTNDHDRKVLQNLRHQVGCHSDCGIYQVSPSNGRHAIPGPPVDGIETIATTFNVSDDLVFNCLVDNCKIEERALSRSKQESEEKLLYQQGGRNRIRGNIKSVYFLPKGDHWEVNKSGSVSMMSNEKELRQTVDLDKTAALGEARREADQVQSELRVLNQEHNRLEHQHTDRQRAWNKAKKHLTTLGTDLNKAAEKIDSIKAEEDTSENFDTDTSDLEEDITKAQTDLDGILEHLGEVKMKISVKAPEVDEARARVEELSSRTQKIQQELAEASNKLTTYMAGQTQREEKLKKKREKVEQYRAIIEKQEGKVATIDADCKEYLKHARTLAYDRIKSKELQERQDRGEQIGHEEFEISQPTDAELEIIDMVEVNNTTEWYRAKIDRLKKKIEDEKRLRNADKEDEVVAREKYERAKRIYEGKKEQLDEIASLKVKLCKDVAQRRERWKSFRGHIARTTSIKFDEILNLKGSSGTVDYDHEDQTLNLIVQKDSADANSQQSDVKALSGGERSFTTIALLMALGESIETPFRIMDEFDVFMDPVARKLTIQQLIETAKTFHNRQFIFITPQDVSSVNTDPMVKILKMTPPSRNNVAGGPSQQTLDFSQSQA